MGSIDMGDTDHVHEIVSRHASVSRVIGYVLLTQTLDADGGIHQYLITPADQDADRTEAMIERGLGAVTR